MQFPTDPLPLVVSLIHDAPPGILQVRHLGLQPQGELRVAQGKTFSTCQHILGNRLERIEAGPGISEQDCCCRARRPPTAQHGHPISCDEGADGQHPSSGHVLTVPWVWQ